MEQRGDLVAVDCIYLVVYALCLKDLRLSVLLEAQQYQLVSLTAQLVGNIVDSQHVASVLRHREPRGQDAYLLGLGRILLQLLAQVGLQSQPFFVAFDGSVDTLLPCDEDDCVGQHDPCHVTACQVHPHVQQPEEHVGHQDGEQRHVHIVTRAHEAVVQVGHVGMERMLAPQDAAHGHTDEVEVRDEQQRVGQHQTVRFGRLDVVRGAELQHQVAQCIAQHQAARVAHEYLCALLGVAPHVIPQEDNQAARDGCREEAEDVHAPVPEGPCEGGKGDEREAAGQAVDTVDKVDGVHREHHQEHREGIAHDVRYLIDAAEAVQIVQREAHEREAQGGNELDEEFQMGRETEEVVQQSRDIDSEDAEPDEQRAGLDGLALAVETEDDGQRHGNTHDGAWHEDHATQPWDVVLVYLAFVRSVEIAIPLAQVQKPGH